MLAFQERVNDGALGILISNAEPAQPLDRIQVFFAWDLERLPRPGGQMVTGGGDGDVLRLGDRQNGSGRPEDCDRRQKIAHEMNYEASARLRSRRGANQ